MYPGPNLIIKCPSCEMLQQRKSLASGNNIGAVYYSDGSAAMPMLKSYPYYIKCPSCGVFFKLTDEIVIGEIPWDHDSLRNKSNNAPEFPDEWLQAPYVKFLTIEEYCQAIVSGLCNSGRKNGTQWKKDIRALRFALWRAFNNSNRIAASGNDKECDDDIGDRSTKTEQNSMKMTEEDRKSVYDANCRAILAAMAGAFGDVNLLIKAEIHRNLGEFQQCTSLLSQIKDQDEYKPFITSIRKACTDHNRLTVMVIDWDREA